MGSVTHIDRQCSPSISGAVSKRHKAGSGWRGGVSRAASRAATRSRHDRSTSPSSSCRAIAFGDGGLLSRHRRQRFLCHGSDSRVDCAVMTVGDHRTMCSPQPAAAERRPPARGAALPWNGRSAAWRRGVGESTEARGTEAAQHFRERGEVRRGGIRSPAAPRRSGQETAGPGEVFRRTELPGRPRL
jgi:hypothetical protein